MDGGPRLNIWDYAINSLDDSLWPTLHSPSPAPTSSPISATYVDCWNDQFLGDVTSQSSPAQDASLLFPTIKALSCGTAVNGFLAAFSYITRPTESSVKCAATLFMTSRIHKAHQSLATHVDWNRPFGIAKAKLDALLWGESVQLITASWTTFWADSTHYSRTWTSFSSGHSMCVNNVYGLS
jgi:hypothetical protein